MIDIILVTRSSMPDYTEYCEEIKKLWDSHWLTNMGEEHEAFQKTLEERLGCSNVVLFSNGHLALENALMAMQFPKGSEVITTPFTFASTTHAIVRNGLIPVFCDINPDNYTIDTDKIEQLITEKTVAIVPVHVYGNICNVERIKEIAEKNHLKVIYDAAHAFAVKYKGLSSAVFGDASMFSFHATKVFNSIEGGAICTQDNTLVEVLKALRNFGMQDANHVIYSAGNAKMNEFQAAMGLCNLRHLDTEIEKRKKVVERYRSILSGVTGIKLCKEQEGVESNYAYFPVVFDGFVETRDGIFSVLEKNGIVARKYFFPLTNSFDCYSTLPSFGKEKTPIAAYFAERVLTLPLYADLPLSIVEKICDIILNCK